MKKIEPTIQAKVSESNFNQKSKKLDLISLIPQIVQILPQVTSLFNTKNKPTPAQNETPQINNEQLKPPEFIHKENQKAAILAMEHHKQIVEKIKNQK